MNPAYQLVIVISVFLAICLSLFLCMRLLVKKRLYGAVGLLIASTMLGTTFASGSFVLITISRKFQYWSLSSKLIYSGEIFLWVFVVGLVLIPIVFRRAQDYVQRDKPKKLEK